MHVLHAIWSEDRLWLWAESAVLWAACGVSLDARPEAASPRPQASEPASGPRPGDQPAQSVAVPGPHPFAADHAAIAACVGGEAGGVAEAHLRLRLPAREGVPTPSPHLAHAAGLTAGDCSGDLHLFTVPALGWPMREALAVMRRLEERLFERANGADSLHAGASLEFFLTAERLARHVLASQRFVPSLRIGRGAVRGRWEPWLGDGPSARRAALLVAGMPPSARACVDHFEHVPWAIVESFLSAAVDAHARLALSREHLERTLDGLDPAREPVVAWLAALLGPQDVLPAGTDVADRVARQVRGWLGRLEDRGVSSQWRLLLRLHEPGPQEPATAPWRLTFHLQAQGHAQAELSAEDIWLLPSSWATVQGLRVDDPHGLLRSELSRAARLYRPLESVLGESEPTHLALETPKAYEFLCEYRDALAEQGFGVEVPAWWDQPTTRLGLRLRVHSDPLDGQAGTRGWSSAGTSRLGLKALVHATWEVTAGGVPLTLAEFERLARTRVPLLRLGNTWVEIRPEDVEAAAAFIRENPGGTMSVGAVLSALGGRWRPAARVPVVSVESQGWIDVLLHGDVERMPVVDTPATFYGRLRPYQMRGLSWLVFLERCGLGALLADDMGLGKTIQVLALLAWERAQAAEAPVAPTLLVVPLSIVGNWVHEMRRFCPHLRVLVHHGPDRLRGEDFRSAVRHVDAVITTYALALRDNETLRQIPWGRLVLDEAQVIKNAWTRQAQAVRELAASSRIALTGTPVENHLMELWSIMDLLNPGYLGPADQFRRRFAIPIERHRDSGQEAVLRRLVRPVLLRRVKSDPAVAADLPEKVEIRQYTPLTSEQASLYESVVGRMLAGIEAARGIQRRGLVLATLVYLKQICNHPAHYLREGDHAGPVRADRSGKCVRLVELLREVIEGGERALVFTQFRRMGALLATMLRHELDCDVLFLHGGTPARERDALITRFQRGDGSAPVFILSLRAGGMGLNLTAASHVFHFDRWWNPAVEAQATDRAYRIGQCRSVAVHKFVARGTLEERIDEMIEQKTDLAQRIIAAGEASLADLSAAQLREILALRREAIGEDL